MLLLIEALKSLKHQGKVTVTTDSQYVQRGATQWLPNWKKNGWKTAGKKPVMNGELWRELDVLNQQYEVQWKWCKGHSGHPENERCHELARAAIKTIPEHTLN